MRFVNRQVVRRPFGVKHKREHFGGSKPQGYWTDEGTQREALENLGREKFGVKELNDWYTVSSEDVCSHLSFIGTYYRGSLSETLKKLYPHHNWDPLRFSKVPHRFWANENTQRDALEKIGEKFGVKELDDWYNVSSEAVKSELSFINNYYGSLYNVLKKLYPQHRWDPLRFSRVPSGYWTNESACREALERIGRDKFGVKEMNDWYSVTAMKVHHELRFIRVIYGSLFNALKKLYPQHEWNPLRFSRIPHKYWQLNETSQHYHSLFSNWKKTYGIKTISDWYQLPPEKVEVFKRVSMGIFGSKLKLLDEWFPDIVWRSQYFSQIEFENVLKHVMADSHIKHHKPKDHFVTVIH